MLCGKDNRIWSIVDLALGDEDGLDLVKEIKTRYPKVPSLVLSMHDEAVYAERALSAGALGYVAKHELDETVLSAIRRALAGETYMSEALQRRLAERYVGGRTLDTASPMHALSDRELQVFGLIGQRPDHAADRRDPEPERQDDRIPPRAYQEQARHRVRRRTCPARDPMGRNRPHRLTPAARGGVLLHAGWGFPYHKEPVGRLMTSRAVWRRARWTGYRRAAQASSAMSRKRTAQSAPVKRRILIVDDHPLVRRGLEGADQRRARPRSSAPRRPPNRMGSARSPPRGRTWRSSISRSATAMVWSW